MDGDGNLIRDYEKNQSHKGTMNPVIGTCHE